MSDDATSAAGLIWDQAKQQLAQQSADVDALRTRAIAMLSVASLVAGLFGSRLPHDHEPGRTVVAVVIALTLFGGSVILALMVAAPKSKWLFTFKLDKLLELVDEHRAASKDVMANLATWAEEARRLNTDKLRMMYVLFSWMCVLVGLQVVAWSIALL